MNDDLLDFINFENNFIRTNKSQTKNNKSTVPRPNNWQQCKIKNIPLYNTQQQKDILTYQSNNDINYVVSPNNLFIPPILLNNNQSDCS